MAPNGRHRPLSRSSRRDVSAQAARCRGGWPARHLGQVFVWLLGGLLAGLVATGSAALADDATQASQRVPIESLDLGKLLGREVKAGEAGLYARVLRKQGRWMDLHGYASIDLVSEPQEGTVTFDLHHVVLVATSEIERWIVAELALELEHNASELYLPTAFVDLVTQPWLIVRIGLFPIPIGTFNEYQYPDFARKTVTVPIVMNDLLPALWSDIGVQARGRVAIGDRKYFNYALYVVNGLSEPGPASEATDDPDEDDTAPNSIRAMRRHPFDVNADKGLGGRVGLALPPGIDMGLSGYSGLTGGSGTRVSLADADLTVQHAGVTLRTEGVVGWIEQDGDTRTPWGAYGLLAWHVHPVVEPWVSADVANLDDGVGTRYRVVGGCVFYPAPTALPLLSIKIEGGVRIERDARVEGHADAQLTIGL